MVGKLCIVVLCLLMVTFEVHCGKKPGRRKKQKSGDEDLKMDEMISLVETLQEKVDQIESAGGCSAGNMHFYFHGDESGHSHQVNDDDHHIHVHIHKDGDHHSMSAHDDEDAHEHKAVCDMHDPSKNIDGFVRFVQKSNSAHAGVLFEFNELGTASGSADYVSHVHVFGDLSQGCGNLGPHYDPYDDDVDVGDLGTVTAVDGKHLDADPSPTDLTLFGDYSIVGRSVVIHDDQGAVACCVIGWATDDFTGDAAHAHMHSHDHSEHSHDHGGHDHGGHDHGGHMG